MSESQSDRSREGIRFQWIVLFVGVALCLAKFVAFLVTASVSILTDAIESIVNVIAAVVGLYALYISAKPRDHDHPFGHGNVEILSSTFEGGLITAAGGIIIFESILRIIEPEEVVDLGIGMGIVAVSMVVNLLVGLGAMARGKRNNSHTLVASGKHLCSDSLSSVGILVGLGIMVALEQFFGIHAPWIDGAVALIFGLIIFIVGFKVVHKSICDSMGKIDPEVIKKGVETLNENRHGQWVDVHDLRVLKVGPVYHVDVHVVFPGMMTVDQQQAEINEVIHAFHETYGDAVDITIMSDSCKGRYCRNCKYECDIRKEEFVGIKEWTPESVCHIDEEKE